jgi:transmembrane protein
MPQWVARLLDRPEFAVVARVLLTLPFWAGGLQRLNDFRASTMELEDYGLRPAGPINGIAIFVLIGGSLLVIINRRTWSGAGALAILALMTVPVAHDFWNLTGHGRAMEFDTMLRHVGLVGGLMLAARLSRHSPRGGA